MNKLKKTQMMNNCPNCGETNIGRLTKYSFFCRECCAEVAITKKNQIYVQIHSEDGAIIRKVKIV